MKYYLLAAGLSALLWNPINVEASDWEISVRGDNPSVLIKVLSYMSPVKDFILTQSLLEKRLIHIERLVVGSTECSDGVCGGPAVYLCSVEAELVYRKGDRNQRRRRERFDFSLSTPCPEEFKKSS